MIEHAKKAHWDSFLENLDDRTVWTTHQYMSGEPTDGGRTRVPTLKVMQTDGGVWNAESNSDNSKALRDTFFLRPVEDGVEADSYPAPHFSFEPVTNLQIQRAIVKLSPHKAVGANGITNIMFTKCADLIVPHLGLIYRATFSLKMYPSQWKDSTTMVLRKPGKPNYTLPNMHQPIPLLNTMVKILLACIAEDLLHMTEVHGLLPDNHFGCRPGRTTTNLLHYVVKYIKDSWRRNEVVSALFLYVKSAFPSLVLAWLVHNMSMQGVPTEYTEWIMCRVEGLTMTLSFDSKGIPSQVSSFNSTMRT